MNTQPLIILSDNKRAKQDARQAMMNRSYCEKLRSKMERYDGYLDQLSHIKISVLDAKIKDGKTLSFEESFVGMCYVLSATNHPFFTLVESKINKAYKRDLSHEHRTMLAGMFLNGMAFKESFVGLHHEELAGMVAAATMDLVFELPAASIVETCGTGGDRGIANGAKTINASTLSAILLSSLEIPTMKHGSYGNTAKVGSTDFVEKLGIKVTMDETEAISLWERTKFLYTDAHWSKTIHDLSHLLMMETVNHIIGPMTIPVSQATVINKVIGVSHKIHPSVVAKAYELLHHKQILTVGNVIVVGGLGDTNLPNNPYSLAAARNIILDEMSPYGSLVAILKNGKYQGSFIIDPKRFGVKIDISQVCVPNEIDRLMQANLDAVTGKDASLCSYLALNASLGLLVSSQDLDLGMFAEAYRQCKEAIISGKARQKLLDCIPIGHVHSLVVT